VVYPRQIHDGVPLANSEGAVLISKKVFDAMPKDIQDILVTNGASISAS